jgi:hypothetical protein
VISPDLSRSSRPEKRAFAAGALAESRLVKGLLYAGTDRGSFWTSKDDGVHWQENSQGIAHTYIRSICPSRFSPSRVYMAMTGLNYDNLHRYLYVSEDYGKKWRNISAGLPDEPVNVILEDPTHENILFAGTIRGVFVSIDRGSSWSYLGTHMPMAAIADLEVDEGTMDLVAGTHGRGIFKVGLGPLYKMVMLGGLSQDHLFTVPRATLPWKNSLGGETDYRAVEKLPISFWLTGSQLVTLALTDSAGKSIWTQAIEGRKGLNQYRWDLIVEKVSSDQAYFIHYDRFLTEGTYHLQLTTTRSAQTQPLVAVRPTSPYIR